MDNFRKKSYKTFNIIDFIILLTIIAIIFFAADIIVNNIFSSETQVIEYTIKISEAQPGTQYHFSIGDKLYAGPSHTHVGNITKIQPKSAEAILFDYNSDEFKQTYINGKYDIYITVRAVCSVKNNIYSINNIQIAANNNPQFIFPFSFAKAEIISIKEIDNNSNTGGNYEEN